MHGPNKIHCRSINEKMRVNLYSSGSYPFKYLNPPHNNWCLTNVDSSPIACNNFYLFKFGVM